MYFRRFAAPHLYTVATLIIILDISVKGFVTVECQDANTPVYRRDVSVKNLLNSVVPRPD